MNKALSRALTGALCLYTLTTSSILIASEDEQSDKHTGEQTGQMHNEEGEALHGHMSWPSPPHEYEAYRNDNWQDQTAAARGMAIFAQQCSQCHGLSGEGNGPLAKSLEHKPANLTQHFHGEDNSGDAYLFWRISEGGTAEPFKSSNSAMPAFKQILNEKQRWDVLTYVHQQIHQGFKLDNEATAGRHDEEEEENHREETSPDHS